MEIKKQEVNPDDLDIIFRGIHLIIEQKENDLEIVIPQLQEKYKNYVLQDVDRKLFNRFLFRITELHEKYKSPFSLNLLNSIREMMQNNKSANLSVILTKLHRGQETDYQNQQEIIIQKKKQAPSWQINNQNNRGLLLFYDSEFWKLYEIMNLHRQYCSNMIVYHQTKEENVERLYQMSLERNCRIIQSLSVPNIDPNSLILKAEQLKISSSQNSTMETPYSNRNIVMFGSSCSPQKRSINTVKHSVSPSRGGTRDGMEREFKSMFDTETSHLFDQNFRITRNKNLSLHNDKQIIQDTSMNRRKARIYQENNSPIGGCKNQNWILPEIKLQNSIELQCNSNQNQKLIEDSFIKPIMITSKNSSSPEKKSRRPPIGQTIFQQTLYQSIMPQYRTNQRAFQTIKNLIRK